MNRTSRSAKPATHWEPSAGKFSTGTNVRRDASDPGIWRPAGMPAVIRRDSWRPLQRIAPFDSAHSIVFMRSGNMLGAIVHKDEPADELAGTVHEICRLDADPLRFDIATTGIIRMMMRHAPTRYIGYAADTDAYATVHFTCYGEMPELPPVIITSGDETVLSEPLPEMRLSGSAPAHGTLGSADTVTATRHLLETYNALLGQGASAGLYIQPTLARYRLLDNAGDCIMTSPPLLVAPASGFQCTGGVTSGSTDWPATLSGGALQAKGFRLQVTIASTLPEPWRSMVSSAVVETSGMIDPVDKEGTCSSSISNDGADTRVTFLLPGIQASGAANITRHRKLIADHLAHSNSQWRIQGKIDRPFSHTSIRQTIPLDPGIQPQAAAGYPPLRDAVSYGAALSSHGLLLLADARHEAFNGYRPENFIHSFGVSGSWKGMVTVNIPAGDGTRRMAVSTGSGSSFPPEAFNPLLTFPDASASEMTVALTTPDGKTVTETYPLTPLPEAGIAYFLSTDLHAIIPGEESSGITMPHTNRMFSTREGQIDICTPLRLSAPCSSFQGSSRKVTAMHEAPRSRGTWDFARQKIILSGSGGISIVTLDGKNTMRSCATLDNRPVAGAVCEASGDSGRELIAIAGTDVVRISQSGVTTIMRLCHAESIAYSPLHDEIWLAEPDGSLFRLTQYGKTTEIVKADVTDDSPSVRLIQWGSRMLISARTLLTDASEETFPEKGIAVELHLRHNRTMRASPLQGVCFNLYASSVNGRLTLKGDSGSRVPQTLTCLDISGALNQPLAMRVMAPVRSWIETSLEATVSADAEWHAPLMKDQ